MPPDMLGEPVIELVGPLVHPGVCQLVLLFIKSDFSDQTPDQRIRGIPLPVYPQPRPSQRHASHHQRNDGCHCLQRHRIPLHLCGPVPGEYHGGDQGRGHGARWPGLALPPVNRPDS